MATSRVQSDSFETALKAAEDVLPHSTSTAAPPPALPKDLARGRSQDPPTRNEVLAGSAAHDFRAETFDALIRGRNPVSPEAAAHWKSTKDFVRERLADGAADNPLLAASLQQLLLEAYRHTFPTPHAATYSAQDDDPPTPATLRRAKSFIEEHAHEPMAVGDIAHAARLSTRGLQEAFQRVFNTTPMAYLTTVRLTGAREDLLNADPLHGATVGEIARRWGFTHLGRFSARYRETHGEPPSTTLRR